MEITFSCPPQEEYTELGIVACVSNPSTQEAEALGS
jgi:hypothetical protein